MSYTLAVPATALSFSAQAAPREEKGDLGSHAAGSVASLARAAVPPPFHQPFPLEAEIGRHFGVSVPTRPSAILRLRATSGCHITSQRGIAKCRLVQAVGALISGALQLWPVFAGSGRSARLLLTATTQHGLQRPAINCSVTTLNF